MNPETKVAEKVLLNSVEQSAQGADVPAAAVPDPASSIKSLRLSENIRSLIASGMFVKGQIETKEGIKIDGTVEGSVKVTGEGSIVVDESGKVIGDLIASRAIILGCVTGNIFCDQVVVYSLARITGDIKYGAIKIADGALINGSLAVKCDSSDVHHDTDASHIPAFVPHSAG